MDQLYRDSKGTGLCRNTMKADAVVHAGNATREPSAFIFD